MANLQDLMTGDPSRDRMIQTLLNPSDFIYSRVAPRLGVPIRSGVVGVVGLGDKITDSSFRADRDVAPEVEDLQITEQSYNCKSIDRKKFIGQGELAHNKYAEPETIKTLYSKKLTDKLMLLTEVILRDTITDLNKYKSDNKATLTGSDQFTHASSKPINLLLTKATLFKQKNGVTADTIVFSYLSYTAFITNASVAPLLPDPKYKVVTPSDLIPLLKTGALSDLKEVIIAGATYDKNSKKDARDGDFIWSDDVFLFKKAVPIEDTRLTEAGFMISVESEDQEDFGSYERREEDKKGITLENRLSFDLMNCSPNESTFDYGMILRDTNG